MPRSSLGVAGKTAYASPEGDPQGTWRSFGNFATSPYQGRHPRTEIPAREGLATGDPDPGRGAAEGRRRSPRSEPASITVRLSLPISCPRAGRCSCCDALGRLETGLRLGRPVAGNVADTAGRENGDRSISKCNDFLRSIVTIRTDDAQTMFRLRNTSGGLASRRAPPAKASKTRLDPCRTPNCPHSCAEHNHVSEPAMPAAGAARRRPP